MNDSKISVRYARALFQSALDHKILDKVSRDMILLSEVCSLPEFRDLLGNPVIFPSKKTVIIHNTIGKNLEKISYALIDLVIRNGRESFLPAIVREFVRETKEYKGITETVLTTAVKVDAKIVKQVSDIVSDAFKTKVELKEVIDRDIIGGFVLRIEDNYIDASVRNKLRKIKKELKGMTIPG
jgi:F-type H+-transporting ATPase subunit delta